jgi:hypothetical protein
MEGLARFEELRFAYDGAFERLRTEVRTLKFAERDRNEDLLDHLQQRVKEVELVYRHRRDELAQYILARRAKNSKKWYQSSAYLQNFVSCKGRAEACATIAPQPG